MKSNTKSNSTKALIEGEIEVGNIVKFGHYFINNDQIKEQIEWRVLDVSDDKALLLTKDAIDTKQYNKKCDTITWEKCSLRQWLNTKFIKQAFNENELNEIALTSISNADNPKYRTNGCENTNDKIFLLSIDEVQKYFNDDKDRECKATTYAIQQGVWINTNQYFGNCYWWLRTASYRYSAAVIVSYGELNVSCHVVDSKRLGVRPALYLTIKN